MHAILCPIPGSPECLQWQEVPTPVPQQDEVLLEVHAAGLNRADILQRQGKYPPPPGASDILGMEVAGIVVATGAGVTRWKQGDRLCALLAGGGYAEYVAVPESHCLPIPETISLRQAAVLPEAVATVWANLFESAGLKAGETALIHGGSSGIGTTAIRMARLAGAKTFATAGSEEKAETCRQLGADFIVNYRMQDFVAAVHDATQGRGVDVALDMVGGDYLNRNLAALGMFGRHVSIATQQGRIAPLDLRLVMQKRLTLTGSTLRNRDKAEKARLIAALAARPWRWVAENRLKPLIHGVYPIKNAAEAHKMMESGAHIGKIVLEVKPETSL